MQQAASLDSCEPACHSAPHRALQRLNSLPLQAGLAEAKLRLVSCQACAQLLAPGLSPQAAVPPLQVEAAKAEVLRAGRGGRPEDREIWETQLVALQVGGAAGVLVHRFGVWRCAPRQQLRLKSRSSGLQQAASQGSPAAEAGRRGLSSPPTAVLGGGSVLPMLACSSWAPQALPGLARFWVWPGCVPWPWLLPTVVYRLPFALQRHQAGRSIVVCRILAAGCPQGGPNQGRG